ncbi:hypothetical protein ORI20_05325 [Mycobacterium sp. CVI_P3]|uniref:Uncharacterized protein n=1 Tax=Mycobacterium pinniadriaticum TaxID=2994102 RepID=A0ABT3S9B9_9MYCO|nr:hypothetical protein [Mycobacterium pinniadriaticum]MCX2929683.1 hypothetical protein [Mycobacterium pinniadriaticum]MCX2936107.1 hypothetical protein [Mycobacterium pinniadriaticum]
MTDVDVFIAGEFATRYRPGPSAVFVIRPDGYLCFAARDSPRGGT